MSKFSQKSQVIIESFQKDRGELPVQQSEELVEFKSLMKDYVRYKIMNEQYGQLDEQGAFRRFVRNVIDYVGEGQGRIPYDKLNFAQQTFRDRVPFRRQLFDVIHRSAGGTSLPRKGRYDTLDMLKDLNRGGLKIAGDVATRGSRDAAAKAWELISDGEGIGGAARNIFKLKAGERMTGPRAFRSFFGPSTDKIIGQNRNLEISIEKLTNDLKTAKPEDAKKINDELTRLQRVRDKNAARIKEVETDKPGFIKKAVRATTRSGAGVGLASELAHASNLVSDDEGDIPPIYKSIGQATTGTGTLSALGNIGMKAVDYGTTVPSMGIGIAKLGGDIASKIFLDKSLDQATRNVLQGAIFNAPVSETEAEIRKNFKGDPNTIRNWKDRIKREHPDARDWALDLLY